MTSAFGSKILKNRNSTDTHEHNRCRIPYGRDPDIGPPKYTPTKSFSGYNPWDYIRDFTVFHYSPNVTHKKHNLAIHTQNTTKLEVLRV